MMMKRPIGEYEKAEARRHGTARPRRVLRHEQRTDWQDVSEADFKRALAVVRRKYARSPIAP